MLPPSRAPQQAAGAQGKSVRILTANLNGLDSICAKSPCRVLSSIFFPGREPLWRFGVIHKGIPLSLKYVKGVEVIKDFIRTKAWQMICDLL